MYTVKNKINNLKNTVTNYLYKAMSIVSDTHGLEAFEIAIGIGIAVVCGVLVLSKNQDLLNSVFSSAQEQANSLFQ